jgi:hypothetical protein
MTEKTMQEKSIFSKLNEINVNDYTSKKGRFTYLSWCYAWGELQKNYPDATYEIIKFNGMPYLYDEKTGYMVFTKLTINNITHEMWLPIMDLQNKAKKNADMMDINKAIMRCLVKNIAMFGLGLYIYAGEDLPETDNEDKPQIPAEKKPEPQKQGNVSVSFETLKEYLLESTSKERLEAIWKRGEPHIVKYTNAQQTEITNIYNNKLAELCTK